MPCEDCYYKSIFVGSKGPEDSPFVIVGESPGTMEAIDKLPFVGPSGEVLDKTLQKMGLGDVKPLYTNAIHCLPQRKDPENLAAACMRCRPRLLAELRAYPRKIILSLGGPALQSLTGNFDLKITKERGKVFKSDLAEVGIVAAVHPAFLLRGSGSLPQFERDLAYAIKLFEKGKDGLVLPDGTEYRVLQNTQEVRDFASDLRNNKLDMDPAGDIETTGLHHRMDKILCFGIQHKPKQATIIPGGLIHPDLFDNDLQWVWHNGKFDIKFFRVRGIGNPQVRHDTMLLNYTLNERRGFHDLDQVAQDWLHEPSHKGVLKPYLEGTVIDEETGLKRKKHYGDVPLPVLYHYLAHDINKTHRLKPVLLPLVEEDKHLRKYYYKSLLPGSEYLAKIEMNGMTADLEWFEANGKRLKRMINRCERLFNAYAHSVGYGQDVNMRSWQQLQKFLYGYLKLLKKVDSSTDDDTLSSIPWIPTPNGKGRKHRAVRLLQRHRRNAKLYGTYVKGLAGDKETGTPSKIADNGRIHPTFKLAATATGRLASEDPNGQNIPRDPRIRGQFIPRPGYAILEIDYSQAELRCLAQLSGCPALSEIFLSGRDLHVEFSTFLFGQHFTKEEKMAAKTVNFGIPYGRTAGSIADDPQLNTKMHITPAIAQGWIDGWAERFPGAWAFIEKCRAAPAKGLTLISVFGNKKRPGVVSAEKLNDIQNEYANFFHQATASLINMHAGMKLIDPLRERYDTHIINTVHDCLVTETPFEVLIEQIGLEATIARVREIAEFMRQVMEAEAPLWGLKNIPFKVEPEFGFRWGNVLKFGEIDKLYNGDFSAVPRYIPAH